MNRVIITGNLVADPEAHTTQSGISRSTFRVAVQRRFKNANGEREADFLTVVVWRQAAEFCNKYLTKGSKVCVEGSIQTRSYDAQDGSKRYVTEIVADNVESLSRNDRPQDGASSASGGYGAPGNDGFVPVEDDGDLPF